MEVWNSDPDRDREHVTVFGHSHPIGSLAGYAARCAAKASAATVGSGTVRRDRAVFGGTSSRVPRAT